MASTAEIQSGLAEILEEVAGVAPADATPEKSFTEDLDVDSLSMVEIATAVEDKFGVAIPDDELGGIKTVGDAITLGGKVHAQGPEAAQAARATQQAPMADGSRPDMKT